MGSIGEPQREGERRLPAAPTPVPGDPAPPRRETPQRRPEPRHEPEPAE